MRGYSNITSCRKEDHVVVTTKLCGRSRRQDKPRRGSRLIRSIRDWFAMCWGRRDHDEMDERERLLDEDEEEEEDDDTEDEEDEDSIDDERLMGPETREHTLVPRHVAISFLKTAAGKSKGCGGWRH